MEQVQKNVRPPVTRRTIKKIAQEAGWQSVSAEEEFGPLVGEKKTRFSIIDADTFSSTFPEAEYFIEGVLPKNGLVGIIGASGSGKSFFAIDMVAHIATAQPWRGMEVEAGKVVYIAAEGAEGIRKRLAAYRHQHGINFCDQFGMICEAPNLLSEDPKELATAILNAGGADVIVIDTLAQTTPGGDENASKDMGKAIESCHHLANATGALVILVHHHGKTAGRGARGWSGIKAALDTEITVSREDEERSAQITKQKDGEEGQVFPFKLMPVSLGFNKHDKELTSCVVQHLDDAPLRKPKRLGKVQRFIYDTVIELSVTSKEQLIEKIIPLILLPTDAKRDRRRDIIIKAINDMINSGMLLHGENQISLPQSHNTPQTTFYGYEPITADMPQMPHDSKGVWQCGEAVGSGNGRKIMDLI